MGTAFSELLLDAARRGIAYREGVGERPVYPRDEAIAALAGFGGPLPEHGRDPQAVLAQLDELGSPATCAAAGGRYFGFVNGSSLPVTVAANWLATAWDQNAGLYLMSPGTITLEEIALRWVLDALRLPAEAAGALVSGATNANFTALAAARHAVLARAGWDIAADGLFGAPPVTIVAGEEVHSTLVRMLRMLGFGRAQMLTLPVDEQGRIIARNLPKLSGPAILCIQAGNVNTGALDPARPLCDWAHQQGAWVHVDGAFGLWARATPTLADQADGYELADSWITDGHKWLNVPYDCGIVLVRDADALRQAMSLTASYLPADGPREPFHYSPDASRRARGVDVWAALATLGRAGVAELVERCCRHARRFAGGLREAGHEILNDVRLNQVLVSFGSPERTRDVIAAIQRDRVCWCGGTVWQGRQAMRISVSSWATTDEDVELSLEAIKRLSANPNAGGTSAG